MTDDTTSSQTTPPGTEAGATGSPASDESFAWREPGDSTGGRRDQAREWVTQLQTMIEQLTTQAAPVVREVGAKAAELAALAGEKAGPVAHRAAEFTAEAGMKIAGRSRDLATELRRDVAGRGEGPLAGDGAASQNADDSPSEPPTTTGIH
jgi:hypothetical protein